VRSLDSRLDDQTAGARFAVLVMAAFAAAALLLAVGGVYGVVSYMVGRRTREIGVRMALGSTRAGILTLMLRAGLLPVSAGLVIGSVTAHVGGRYVSSLLYGLEATDPAHLLSMMAILGAVAALASLVPALRAARVSPTVALRGE
jgi:ABC-type antimicrobial peptide transport system permease subunit